MEQNNGKEVWQTIGAIVGSLSGIIALVLQAGRLTAWARRILKWSRGRWSMLRQWCYSRQHSPLFTISKTGVSPFRISKSDGSAEIEVTGTWQSREISINKTIIGYSMALSIGNSYPQLSCHPNILTLNQKPVKVTYKFIGNVYTSPLVNLDSLLKQIKPIVKCKITVEKIQSRNIMPRSLKIKPFNAKVEYR